MRKPNPLTRPFDRTIDPVHTYVETVRAVRSTPRPSWPPHRAFVEVLSEVAIRVARFNFYATHLLHHLQRAEERRASGGQQLEGGEMWLLGWEACELAESAARCPCGPACPCS